jgi:hypothetical protein
VVLAWTLAGGAVGGGLATAALELAGRSTPGLLILVGPVLYLAGTLLGMALGGLLGVVGRPEGTTRRDAIRRVGIGVVMSLVLQPLSWLTSASITVGSALRLGFRPEWALVGLVGWGIGAAACLWALHEARPLVRRVLSRLGSSLRAIAGLSPDRDPRSVTDASDREGAPEPGLSPGLEMGGPAS